MEEHTQGLHADATRAGVSGSAWAGAALAHAEPETLRGALRRYASRGPGPSPDGVQSASCQQYDDPNDDIADGNQEQDAERSFARAGVVGFTNLLTQDVASQSSAARFP